MVNIRPEELELVRTAIGPGEPIRAVARFIGLSGTSVRGPLSAALTPRSLHMISCRRRRGRLEISGHGTIPLTKISAVHSKKKIRNKPYTLTFWWEGKEENLLSTFDQEAEEFTATLNQLVSTSASAPAAAMSVADEIAKLSQLADEGILSQEELTRAKEMFLGKPPSQIDESIRLLRNLKDLHKSGVLSESEFNMKKWDVMSKRDFQ